MHNQPYDPPKPFEGFFAGSDIFCTHIVACEVVNIGLRQHGVILQLRFPQRRCVASNDDQLSLARSESLEG